MPCASRAGSCRSAAGFPTGGVRQACGSAGLCSATLRRAEGAAGSSGGCPGAGAAPPARQASRARAPRAIAVRAPSPPGSRRPLPRTHRWKKPPVPPHSVLNANGCVCVWGGSSSLHPCPALPLPAGMEGRRGGRRDGARGFGAGECSCPRPPARPRGRPQSLPRRRRRRSPPSLPSCARPFPRRHRRHLSAPPRSALGPGGLPPPRADPRPGCPTRRRGRAPLTHCPAAGCRCRW